MLRVIMLRAILSFMILLKNCIQAESLMNLEIAEISAETEIIDGEHTNCRIDDLKLDSLKFKFNCGVEASSNRLECWSDCSSKNNEIKIGFQCDCHVSIGMSLKFMAIHGLNSGNFWIFYPSESILKRQSSVCRAFKSIRMIPKWTPFYGILR